VQTLLKRSARSYWSFVTEQLLTVGFRPQANGIVDEIKKRLLQVIINEKNSPDKGSSALPLGQRILNTSTVGRIHRSEKLVEICSRFGRYKKRFWRVLKQVSQIMRVRRLRRSKRRMARGQV
jgi:hypothetical protein